MCEMLEHSHCDNESSGSEKDSVYEIFGTVINFLEYIYMKMCLKIHPYLRIWLRNISL